MIGKNQKVFLWVLFALTVLGTFIPDILRQLVAVEFPEDVREERGALAALLVWLWGKMLVSSWVYAFSLPMKISMIWMIVLLVLAYGKDSLVKWIMIADAVLHGILIVSWSIIAGFVFASEQDQTPVLCFIGILFVLNLATFISELVFLSAKRASGTSHGMGST